MNKIIASLFLISVLVISACVQTIDPIKKDPVKKDPVKKDPVEKDPVELEGIQKFDTAQEVLEYVQKGQASSQSYGFARGGMMEEMAMDSVASAPMAKTTAVSNGGGAQDYSETNVQVQGVDEADIVKNDGKYIYTINQENLIIVDAFPAKDAEIVYEDELPGRPKQIFVNGDRLAVFLEENDEVMSIQPYDYMPRPRYVQQTRVIVYDISDRSDPDKVQDYTLTGNYFQSRMIGDHVYFIAKENVHYYDNFIDLPAVRESGSVVVRPEIYYFDNPEDNYIFHTIASFDISDDDEDMEAHTFLMGYSNTLYVSMDNIYISYQKNLPWRYYDQDREDRFTEVVLPLLPANVKSEIKDLQKSNDKDYVKWVEISEVLEEMYKDLDEDDAEDLVEDIMEAVEEYEIKKEIDRRKTIIHKIAIDDGDIDYKTGGEVPGYLHNQFSLDEHDGNLRVATTVNIWRGGRETFNNVYVLDEDMDIIGELEGIAPDETIYSTRFMGDRLYMVTFQRIDPFFVIDLSDPKDPEILGELKIPGFSDYLHPYDENHIIGLGKETEGNQWGGVSIKGVKLGLFDVSDVENPKQVDTYEIGDRGTDSEALRDHKAFLFDKDKALLVIPVREVKENRIYERGYYSDRVWQGAYVFDVTKSGFDLKGKVSHQEGLEKYYYYYNGNAVRRALFMDDVLYTVSGKRIKMNDLDDLDEINEIEMDWDMERPYYWY